MNQDPTQKQEVKDNTLILYSKYELLAKLSEENKRLKKYLQHLFDSFSDEWTNSEQERFNKVMNGRDPF